MKIKERVMVDDGSPFLKKIAENLQRLEQALKEGRLEDAAQIAHENEALSEKVADLVFMKSLKKSDQGKGSFWPKLKQAFRFGMSVLKRFGPEAIAAGLLIFIGLELISRPKNGLIGEYFADPAFSQFNKASLDQEIDFHWPLIGPLKNFRRERISIRWTGYLYAPEDGEYEFVALSDDGSNLWVDGKHIIHNWDKQWPTAKRGWIQLTKGYHPIRLDYFQWDRGATIRLLWKRPLEEKDTVISRKFLFPDNPAPQPVQPAAS